MKNDIGLLVLRVGVGSLFASHGWGKLMNLVNGQTDFPDPLGVGSTASLILAVFAEFICSILVIVGFKVRLSAIPPLVTMLVAAFVFHAGDPMEVKELAFLYAVPFASLALLGGGEFSLDGVLRRRR